MAGLNVLHNSTTRRMAERQPRHNSHVHCAHEQNLSVRIYDLGRNRRLVGIGVIREQPHGEKTEQHHERHRLNPAFGDQQFLI